MAEVPYPKSFRAARGKFRVVEIDISVATGLDGDPEHCARVVGDEPTLATAIRAARRISRCDGFYGQVHDAQGACVYPK